MPARAGVSADLEVFEILQIAVDARAETTQHLAVTTVSCKFIGSDRNPELLSTNVLAEYPGGDKHAEIVKYCGQQFDNSIFNQVNKLADTGELPSCTSACFS